MRLLTLTRGHIILEADGKKVTVYGEAFLRGHGSPDFVVYSNSMERWDAPNDAELISNQKKAEIIEFLQSEFNIRNMKIEIE